MIMISTLETDKINKNFIIHLEALISKLTVSKPDIFVEFLSYFIKNGRIDDALELYSSRLKYMSYMIHRSVPLVRVNMSCYGLLLNYLEWKRKLAAGSEVEFDVSIQGWLVNGMGPLKAVEHNNEIFVMCIVNVLLHYGFWKKAYLFASEFQRSNRDNLAAQLLLYRLIDKFNPRSGPKRRRMLANYMELTTDEEEQARERHRSTELDAINNFSLQECKVPVRSDEFPIMTDKKNILDNLRRLDPTRDELIELSGTYLEKVEVIRLIMDSLEHKSKTKDPSRWRCLQDTLNQVISSNDPVFIGRVADLWRTRYQQFWVTEHLLLLAADDKSGGKVKHRKLIKGVIKTFKSKFEDNTEFVIDR